MINNKKDKDRTLDLMLNTLISKYNSEVQRKDKLEEKGYRWIFVSFIYMAFYMTLRCFLSLHMVKLPFIVNFIICLLYVFFCGFNLGTLYIIYGIKSREEVDILSQWDDLMADTYSACIYSIRYALMKIIKNLEKQNDKLANNIRVISLIDTIGGFVTLIICIWGIYIGN